jgi:hypothetical protein
MEVDGRDSPPPTLLVKLKLNTPTQVETQSISDDGEQHLTTETQVPAGLVHLANVLSEQTKETESAQENIFMALSFLNDIEQCYSISKYIAETKPKFKDLSYNELVHYGPEEYFWGSLSDAIECLTQTSPLLKYVQISY